MATTVSGKLAGMERDCQALVAHFNKSGNYREGSQMQSLLQQVGAVRVAMERSEVANQEFPAKA